MNVEERPEGWCPWCATTHQVALHSMPTEELLRYLFAHRMQEVAILGYTLHHGPPPQAPAEKPKRRRGARVR